MMLMMVLLREWEWNLWEEQRCCRRRSRLWTRRPVTRTTNTLNRPSLLSAGLGPETEAAPSLGWGPRGQGPSRNRQGPGKNNRTDHVPFPSGFPDNKTFGYSGAFLVLKIEKDQMATLCSTEAGVDGWVTPTLIQPVTRLKCIVWVLSLFGKHRCSDMARVYGLYGPRPGPRMGPTDNLSLVTGSNRSKVKYTSICIANYAQRL